MTRPAASSPAPAPHPSSGPALRREPGIIAALIGAAVLCLVIITLAHPGATRMYSWPWSLAYLNALALPAIVLVLRAFETRRPMILPAGEWLAFAVAAALVILVSALASPFRAQSLQWSAPFFAAVAVFFLTIDWLNRDPGRTIERRDRARNVVLALLAVIAGVSMVLWFRQARHAGSAGMLAIRNFFPLGHPNYTAGLALLILPTAVVMVRRRRGRWQITAALVVALALGLLFTSGSRGGLIGLAVLGVAGLVAAPFSRRKKWQFAFAGGLAALAFTVAHPRTRAMFLPADPGIAPNISNVQREAMLVAGWRMGIDRPLLGWGPGVTPLAFPRYRAGLEGGAENVLQLHSLPAQVWAEFGGAGIICLFAFIVLLTRAAPRDLCAAATLAGYGVFSLTDWQLDVPIIAGAIAVFTALLAPPALETSSFRARRAIGSLAVACVTLCALLGRRDPVPEINVRALMLARDPADADKAISLLYESLALNPDQEIAHFNLGWLHLVTAPTKAEQHFLAAAHLVPDKGGVYFGLGLARLNQGRRDGAAHAFAMEALNDPIFLTSPWWREPSIGAVRESAAMEFARLISMAGSALPPESWAAAQIPKMARRGAQLGQVPPGPERTYRRERTGYPVLMRALDLPAPLDLFDVRESVADSSAQGETLPAKGWLPSPVLLSLLDTQPATPGVNQNKK